MNTICRIKSWFILLSTLTYTLIFVSNINASSYRVTASSLNVRSAPSVNAKKLFSIPQGTIVDAIGAENDDWMLVEVNGVTGYVSGKYVDPVYQESPQESDSNRAYRNIATSETLAFWVSFVLFILLYFAYQVLIEDNPYIALLCNLGAAICVASYAAREPDAFWFLDFEQRGFIIYFILLVLIYAFMSFAFSELWQNLCLIKGLFIKPILAIIGVVTGVVWLGAIMWFIADFLMEHTMVAILALIGSIPSSRYIGSFTDRDGNRWDVYER